MKLAETDAVQPSPETLLHEFGPDLDTLGAAALEAESRPMRCSPIEILEYTPSSGDPARQLAGPGTVTLFLARKGSPVLDEIRAAASGGQDQQLTARLRAQSKGRTPLPLNRALEMLKAQPVFADVRYGGLTLASNYFVPGDAACSAVVLPYNGGRLARQGFTLVEHWRAADDSPLQAVALLHAPPLTAAEKAALEQVPADQLELNVGKSYMCWALSAIALAALVTLAAICTYQPESDDDHRGPGDHLDEDEILALGPAATARELLRLRRRKLEGAMSRRIRRRVVA